LQRTTAHLPNWLRESRDRRRLRPGLPLRPSANLKSDAKEGRRKILTTPRRRKRDPYDIPWWRDHEIRRGIGVLTALVLMVGFSVWWYHQWWLREPVDADCLSAQIAHDSDAQADPWLNGNYPRPRCLDNDGVYRQNP
jgi:hypothetical protein